MATKICRRCNVEKDVSLFGKEKRYKNGLQSRCKICKNETGKEYRDKEENKRKAREYSAIYRKGHKEYFKGYSRSRYIENRDDRIRKSKDYYNNNKDKSHQRWLIQKNDPNSYHNTHKEQRRIKSKEHYEKKWDYYYKWRQEHKDIRNKQNKKYLENNPNAQLANGLRSRIRIALLTNGNNIKKQFKSMDLVGCTIAFLRDYLTSLFTEGMSWDNYGNKKDQWSIDHILPCCSFDLSDPEQQKQCFHYTNLQPLWHLDNLSKGKKRRY